MSGVIDSKGQWEHCNGCGKLVIIEHLNYEEPSAQYQHGRDLCDTCYKPAVMHPTQEELVAALWLDVGARGEYCDGIKVKVS